MRIPDITERFPEGYDGEDITDRLMGGWNDRDDFYNWADDYLEEEEEE